MTNIILRKINIKCLLKPKNFQFCGKKRFYLNTFKISTAAKLSEEPQCLLESDEQRVYKIKSGVPTFSNSTEIKTVYGRYRELHLQSASRSKTDNPCQPPKKPETDNPCQPPKEPETVNPCQKPKEPEIEDPCKKILENTGNPCQPPKEPETDDPCKKMREKTDNPCQQPKEPEIEDPCKKMREAIDNPCQSPKEPELDDPCKSFREKTDNPCQPPKEPELDDPCKNMREKTDNPCQPPKEPETDDPCKKMREKTDNPCQQPKEPEIEDPCKKMREAIDNPCQSPKEPELDDPCKSFREKTDNPCQPPKEPELDDPCKNMREKTDNPCQPPKEPETEDPCKKILEKTDNPCPPPIDPKMDDPCKNMREKIDKNPCATQGSDGSGDKGQNMEALVLHFERQEVCLEKLPIPKEIKKDEVLVKVHYAGANLTDIAIMQKNIKSSLKKVVPGREMSGVVFGVGENVVHVKAEDQVVVAPCMPYSLCRFCSEHGCLNCVKELSGKPLGVERDGGWSEYCVAPMNTVYKTPECTLEQAALLPAMSQIMSTLINLPIQLYQEVVIIGAELHGLLFASMLRYNNHDNVYICEDNPNRVKLVECMELGFPVINDDQLCDTTPDWVICCRVGSTVIQRALNVMSEHGTLVIYGATGGNGSSPEFPVQPSELSRKRLVIQGTEGTPANASNVPASLINKILKPEKLGVEIIPLKNFTEGLNKLRVRDTNHTLFKM